MPPILKNLAEALLLFPLFWGSVAFVGWLIQHQQIWIDIGFVSLGIGLIGMFIAFLIWGLRMFHPRFDPPEVPWRVPGLAMLDIVAVATYFIIALNLPIWTLISIENTGSQPVTALEVDCLEEEHLKAVLEPHQLYQIRCIPEQAGELKISWISQNKSHLVQLGKLSPGTPQRLLFQIDEQGEIRGL